MPGSRQEPQEATLRDAGEDKARETEGRMGTRTTQRTGLSAEPGQNLETDERRCAGTQW